jgi:hypothetical protein
MITDEQRAVAKPISFMPELRILVEMGFKTVTRRLTSKLKAGDILYLTETHWAFGHWEQVMKGERLGWKFVCDDPDNIEFGHIDGSRSSINKANPGSPCWYKRNARFMPRKYARTFIRIVDVRQELLQNITDEDVIKEGGQVGAFGRVGLRFHSSEAGRTFPYHQTFFAALWDGLHGTISTSWAANPPVVRLEFELIDTWIWKI